MSGFFTPEEWVYEIGYENYKIKTVRTGLISTYIFIGTVSGDNYMLERLGPNKFKLSKADSYSQASVIFDSIPDSFQYIKEAEDVGV